ncbi:kin of IRRE-like protein 2 [Patiria miniata]|uniref:Ig-like domain-containing protein n=1 Tax=Patiria miniata TaxID=46514 RepID=A0A913ZX07_PATMI|nr:kin of IRRE-like protein 2 [Patiria miniata]
MYMCAYWPDCPAGDVGFGAKTARVTVSLPKDSPSLTCNSLSTELTRGVATEVALQCTATKELAGRGLKLSWFREDERLLNPDQEADDNVYLRHLLQADENGLRFYCEVNGPHGKESCSEVPLNIPPTLSLTPTSQTVYEGTDAVFTCTASGMPYIQTFTWYVEETRTLMKDSGSRVLVEKGDGTSSLRLKRVKTSAHSRSIACVVAVPSGVSANATGSLMVQKAERVEAVLSPGGQVDVPPSTSVFFTCSALPSELTSVASFAWSS